MSAAEQLAKIDKIVSEYIAEKDGAEDPDHPEHMQTLLLIAERLVAEVVRLDKMAAPMSGHDALVQFSGWMGCTKSDGTSATTIEMKAPTDVWMRALAAMANREPLPKERVVHRREAGRSDAVSDATDSAIRDAARSLLLEPLTEERVLRALRAAAHWGELDGMDRSVRIAEEMPASADAADVAVELRSHHAATVRERFPATRTS